MSRVPPELINALIQQVEGVLLRHRVTETELAEVVMREVVNESIRKLTKRHLVVNWKGGNRLFYRMSKAQMRLALTCRDGQMVEMSQTYEGDKDVATYSVRRFRSGNMAIGCEHFKKAEVAELKKWSRA